MNNNHKTQVGTLKPCPFCGGEAEVTHRGNAGDLWAYLPDPASVKEGLIHGGS